jgi:hypothetical protein
MPNLECTANPHTCRLAGAGNQGDSTTRPHPKQVLHHLLTSMLLAHLEDEKWQSLQIGQDNLYRNVGHLQYESISLGCPVAT